MKGPFCALAICAALAASDARAQTAPPLSGSAVAAQVEAQYASVAQWTATVTQTYRAKAYNQSHTSQGSASSSQSASGTNVTLNGQQTFVPCSTPSAFFFLCGSLGFSAFTYQAFSGAQINFPGGVVLVGTPVIPTPTVVKVLFYVDATTLAVRRSTVIDGAGNLMIYDFK